MTLGGIPENFSTINWVVFEEVNLNIFRYFLQKLRPGGRQGVHKSYTRILPILIHY